jgi:hypothetical protein
MGWFLTPEQALARVVADENAPVKDRVTALGMIEHPALELLRPLLVRSMPHLQRSPRPPKKPIPAKLRSLAAIKFAREVRFRQDRARARGISPTDVDAATGTGNPLGV